LKKSIALGFIILVFLTPFLSMAQENKLIDSLLNSLEKISNDTVKVDLLNDLSEAYRMAKSPKAANYVEEAFFLSEKIGFTRGIADAQKIMGIQAFYKADYVCYVNQLF